MGRDSSLECLWLWLSWSGVLLEWLLWNKSGLGVRLLGVWEILFEDSLHLSYDKIVRDPSVKRTEPCTIRLRDSLEWGRRIGEGDIGRQ